MKNHKSNAASPKKDTLTLRILIFMIIGMVVGLVLRFTPDSWQLNKYLVDGIFNIVGTIFINLMEMLVVPIVLVSLICGICSMDDVRKLGSIGIKSLIIFISTTAISVILGLTFAKLFNIGAGLHLIATAATPDSLPPNIQQHVLSWQTFFINLFPSNIVKALAEMNVLQIIVFAIFFGFALNFSGAAGKRLITFFQDLNAIIMKMVIMLMQLAPYGVFCLIASLFAKLGIQAAESLLGYFMTVILVLLLQTAVVYSFLIRVFAKPNPKLFFQKIYSVMLFAFSISSSNASIPLMLETARDELGIDNAIASFVIPLGVNLNKNGSAIMQGVAAIFIAHAYGVNIGFMGDLVIILTSMFASIGSAGVPSGGVFALAIVLTQLGLPLQGLAMVSGIDRLLDMSRTAVTVAGNMMATCIIAKTENAIDVNAQRNG